MSEPAAMLAACFWSFNTYVLVFLYKTGVESGITIFLVVALLYALYKLEITWRTRRPGLLQIAGIGVLSALAVFGRLDLIFFALVFGLWLVFRESPLRYFLPLDVLAVAVATIAAVLARLGFNAYYDVSDSVIIMLVAALACKLPIFYFAGLYRPAGSWRLGSIIRSMLLSVLGGSSGMAIILLGGSALGFL